ncbi:hypothetical protein, partial [Bacillus subtilis]|uniref:hypothetical protein n=1 Tax=Bacillus subtilis TaxID=1423 RepID=UPI003C26109D
EECEIALKEMLEKNWIKPNKDFIYPTELGIKIFEETKDYWFKLYKEKRRVDGQNQINKL